MWTSFWHLVWHSVTYMPSIISGNWVGIFFPLGIYIAREAVRVKNGGWRAMTWRNVQRDTWIMIGAYGLLFSWAVVHTTYEGHRRLADNNAALAQNLEAQRKKGQYETSFLNSFAYTNTVIAFGYLRGLAGHGQDAGICPLKITAPPENAAIRQSLTSIAVAFDCSVIPERRPEIDPDAEDEVLRGAIADTVVIHAVKDNPSADGFITSMGNTFHIRRSFDMPVNSPKNLVWVQIGRGDVWRK